MPFDKHISKSNLSTKNANSNTLFIIRNEQDAHTLFSQFLSDEQAAKTAAAAFIKLGKELSRNTVNNKTGEHVYQRFYEQIVRDSRTGNERTQEEKVIALNKTLTAMREENLEVRSSPEARLAHLEIASYNNTTDNLRGLFETPENRTRAEHSSYLNSVNQEARDLYERGATLYGNTLIIPREANGLQESKDKVRIGSVSHAIEEFAQFIGEEKAKEKAAEFVELGKNIAGRTTDGDTLIVIFREFYNQIKRDDTGRILSSSERSERLDVVLERMRELSDAMTKEEWQREPIEILSLDDWERGLELRQIDSDNGYNGRLAYRFEGTLEPDIDDEVERERINGRTEELTRTNDNFSNISYERIRLDDMPPRFPQNLSQEDEMRLRYETIPLIDRAIENGARPNNILNTLVVKTNVEEQKQRDAEITRIFLERAPSANREHTVTRDEEARALYTLQTLGVIGNEAIKEKGFTLRERADAIDVVGTRLAQDYRALSDKLKTFSELEAEREQLALAAKEYSDTQRKSPEFQALFSTLHKQENADSLLLRAQLQNLLINPEIEKSQNLNAERLTGITNYFRRITNQDISNSDEARTALTPELKQMRLALNRLAAERSTIKIERTLGNETLQKPIYIGLASKNGLRLAVENLNEYKTIEQVATNLSINLETYKGRYEKPINSYSISREEELSFAREYVNYRLLDETTRLKNSNRLFREYNARLNNACSTDELRETIKTIRQENYAREKFPERYKNETETIKRSGEQPRKPLNEIELKKLFLSLPPTHYTQEMRDLRMSYSLTKREKEERVKGLENGILTPSFTLKTLLSEFDRTKSNNPTQTARNINAFLADYINPPSRERNRFSPHNLFELRQNLTSAESDYFFKVVDGARQTAIANTQTKQLEQQEQQGKKERIQETKTKDVQQPKSLQDVIEERVSDYLVSVIKTRGIQALESNREGLEHAANISRIIKETFKQNGREIGDYKISDERIATVAGKLVGELPSAIREYGKQIGTKQDIERLPSLENARRDIKDLREVSNREETIRVATQSALEPLVNQRENENKKERTNEAVLNLNQEQIQSQSALSQTAINQPRPQDIASRNQIQKENRYVLSR